MKVSLTIAEKHHYVKKESDNFCYLKTRQLDELSELNTRTTILE